MLDFGGSASDGASDDHVESDDANAKAGLHDPAEMAFQHENYLNGLKRDRALNNVASVRGKAQDLAVRNEIDLDSSSQRWPPSAVLDQTSRSARGRPARSLSKA